ncbi:MAG: aminotransferase class V-fold PLP-dependent enzyme [Polyangiaceae bacterium]|nr:aminotransferase class V-fold PLP-dependent enzyme [Polyangiaceae bacterium]
MTTCAPELLSLFVAYGTTHESPDVERAVMDGLARFFAARPGEADSADDLGRRFADSHMPSGATVEAYLRYLFDDVVPHSVPVHSPHFMGHMTSALPSFVAPLGRIMTALNQNVVKLETSNAFTFYERQALAILHRLVYGRDQAFYDAHIQHTESTLGMLASGGTLANLAALWCARNVRLGPKGDFAGVRVEGMTEALRAYGCQRAVIVASSAAHYSLDKAVDLLGLGRSALVKVPTTHGGSIDLALLEEALAQCEREGSLVLALVGVAGTTETGAVDPLSPMADLAEAHHCYFHVDAAWGGPVLFSEKHRGLLDGIARADSVTIDGHKQLYAPMGIGTVLFRDPETARAIETNASYIVRGGSPDLGRRTLEGSRPAMAIYLHGALHIIGRNGYRSLVEEGISKAAFLARTIESRPELELLAEPQLNIVVYRFIPKALRERVQARSLDRDGNDSINELNQRLQEAQRDGGASFISRTTLRGTRYGADVPVVVLRAVLANPLTSRDDILAMLDEQIALGDCLAG